MLRLIAAAATAALGVLVGAWLLRQIVPWAILALAALILIGWR